MSEDSEPQEEDSVPLRYYSGDAAVSDVAMGVGCLESVGCLGDLAGCFPLVFGAAVIGALFAAASMQTTTCRQRDPELRSRGRLAR